MRVSGALTDVAGLAVGHHTDPRRPTGCTVVLCGRHGAVAGVDVRGAAPGTRETDLLEPGNAVERVHAVLLAGGSAFGLDAAAGVMRWLDERGIGVAVGPARVPIVPAAVLFDLWLGDARVRPDAAAGHAACAAAGTAPPARGSVGAGAGATVGKLWGIGRAMKGGIGTASLRVRVPAADGTAGFDLTVGALVAVNPVGDVRDPATGRLVAGARDAADGRALHGSLRALRAGDVPPALLAGGTAGGLAGTATTIGVVATDAVLTRTQARRVAQMAHDGLARTIEPVHTLTDGDALFALGTGAAGRTAHVTLVGALAAEAVAEAVLDAVRQAVAVAGDGVPPLPAARDLAPP